MAAADRIMDRGVRFKMPAPFLIRVLRLNRLTVRPLRPGAILAFSKIVIAHNLEDAVMLNKHDAIIAATEAMSKCISVAILNNKWRIRWFAGLLSNWIMWRATYGQILEMFIILNELNKAQDFTPITIFFCHQTQLMMNPKNMGHDANGR